MKKIKFPNLEKSSIVVVFLTLVAVIGLFVGLRTVSKLGELKAGTNGSFLTVTQNGNALTGDTTITAPDSTVALTSNTNSNLLVKIPASKDYSIGIVEDGAEKAPSSVKSSDFDESKLEKELGLVDSSEATVTTSDILEVEGADDSQSGTYYLSLVKGSEVNLVIHHLTDAGTTITATNVSSGETQDLFGFSGADNDSTDASGVVHEVETTSTNQSLEELQSQSYVSEDSLVKPVMFASAISPKAVDNTPILVSSASIIQQTGTATFDTDPKGSSDNSGNYTPGLDTDATNDLVRSNDMVTYGLSFSLSANSANSAKYSDIQYQVTATLPNAITVQTLGGVSNTPHINATIANGTLYDSTTNTAITGNPSGPAYSQGVMSSSISDTGQVFLPVVVNVLDAANGLKLIPQFTVKVISAVNTETGQTETWNQSYTMNDIPSLAPTPVTVSSVPSIDMRVVGKNYAGSDIFGSSTKQNTALDVGVVAQLAPLSIGHNSTNTTTQDLKGAVFPQGNISYQLALSGTDSSTTKPLVPGTNLSNFTINAYANKGAVPNHAGPWTVINGTGTVNTSKFGTPLAVPNAQTGQLTMTEPTGDPSTDGVFNSGTFSTTGGSSANGSYYNSAVITNSSPVPIVSPYMYDMVGSRLADKGTSFNSKAYSSGEFVIGWDSTSNLSNGANLSLSVKNIQYDGQTKASGNLGYSWNVAKSGSGTVTQGWSRQFNMGSTISAPISAGLDTSAGTSSGITTGSINTITGTKFGNNAVNMTLPSNADVNTSSSLAPGSIVYAGGSYSDQMQIGQTNSGNSKVDGGYDLISMWDPSVFSVDNTSNYIPVLQNNISGYAAPAGYPTQGTGIGTTMAFTTGLKIEYGVAKNFNNTSPASVSGSAQQSGGFATSQMKVGTFAQNYANYNWYATKAAALAAGQVSAVAYHATLDPQVVSMTQQAINSTPFLTVWFGTPLKINPTLSGTVSPNNHPMVVLNSAQFTDGSGKLTSQANGAMSSGAVNFDFIGNWKVTDSTGDSEFQGSTISGPDSSNNGTYLPIAGTRANPVKSDPSKMISDNGVTLLLGTQTQNIWTKTINKGPGVYQSLDTVKLAVQGYLTGQAGTKASGNLQTTLPYGVTYKAGTSVDASGKTLPEPTITWSNNLEVLTWSYSDVAILTQINSNQWQSTPDIEVDFNATINPILVGAKPGFSTTTQITNSALTVSSVGSVWTAGSGATSDTSGNSVAARSSSDSFYVQNQAQIIVSKQADKTAIETGNTLVTGTSGATDSTIDTSINYSLSLGNNSANPIVNAVELEVLPYNGDSRGSKISGTYKLNNFSINYLSAPDSSGNSTQLPNNYQLYYTTQSINSSSTINEKSDSKAALAEAIKSVAAGDGKWKQCTNLNDLTEATAIVISQGKINVGEQLNVNFKLNPTGQQPGDVFKNNITFNSDISATSNSSTGIVTSQTFSTRVYGRDLSGFVWQDKNVDGLYQSNEPYLSGIGVKLYRVPDGQDDITTNGKLVTQDLQGNAFVDQSGNSLITTNSQGKYIFSNIPEGTYYVEFQIDGQIQKQEFTVTKPNVGDDDSINSKASQNSPYDTTSYSTSGLNLTQLPDALSSQVSSNNDYVQHMTNVNLGVVPNEVTDLYLIKYEAGTTVDKNGDGQPDVDTDYHLTQGNALANSSFNLLDNNGNVIKTGTTDSYGQIHFGDVAPGNYTVIETKAPTGYELIKVPVPVTVEAGSTQTQVIFVADSRQTLLPFTGANSALQIGIVIASGLTLMGLLFFGGKYQWMEVKMRRKEAEQ